MKKRIIYLFMTIVSLALLSACGGGGDEPVTIKEDYAVKAAGVYGGDLKITTNTGLEIIQANTANLTRTETNKVNLKLNAFTFKIQKASASVSQNEPILRNVEYEDVTVSAINIDGVEVAKTGEELTLKEKTITLDVTRNAVVEKVNVTISAAKVNAKNLTMSISIPMTKNPVTAVFTGVKP